MTRTVGIPDTTTHEQATALSGEHDVEAAEYTIYPTCAGDDDLLTTWLTVDDDAVTDLTNWR